jgi:hypothetical protein
MIGAGLEVDKNNMKSENQDLLHCIATMMLCEGTLALATVEPLVRSLKLESVFEHERMSIFSERRVSRRAVIRRKSTVRNEVWDDE